jgi:hypothetical protein
VPAICAALLRRIITPGTVVVAAAAAAAAAAALVAVVATANGCSFSVSIHRGGNLFDFIDIIVIRIAFAYRLLVWLQACCIQRV